MHSPQGISTCTAIRKPLSQAQKSPPRTGDFARNQPSHFGHHKIDIHGVHAPAAVLGGTVEIAHGDPYNATRRDIDDGTAGEAFACLGVIGDGWPYGTIGAKRERARIEFPDNALGLAPPGAAALAVRNDGLTDLGTR